MWSQYDFEAIEALHEEVAEDYSDPNHPHGEHARVLLTATQNLHDTDTALRHVYGDIIGDEHKMQLFYLRRGLRSLFSVYQAAKHHHYSTAYSRIRGCHRTSSTPKSRVNAEVDEFSDPAR